MNRDTRVGMRSTLVGLFVVGIVAAGVLYVRGATMGFHAHRGDPVPTIELVGFLTLGLLGSFGHCVGMCSPFVLFVSRACGADRRSALAAQGYYTAGRVLTYSVLGATAGLVGAAVQTAGALVGLHRAAVVIAGTVLVVWALFALLPLGPSPGWTAGAADRVLTRVASAVKRRVPGHPFATGMFLGLLPCGFLYSAVIAAVACGSALQGAVALTLFGLGTAPALLGVSVADDLLARRRTLLNRLSQLFILAMGARFLWMALAR